MSGYYGTTQLAEEVELHQHQRSLKKSKKKASKKRAANQDAAAEKEAVANKPPTTSHHNAGGFRAKLDRKLTKLDRTFDLIPVPKPRTPPPPLDAYERDGCELIGETVFFDGPRPAVRKGRVSAAEWEAALALVAACEARATERLRLRLGGKPRAPPPPRTVDRRIYHFLQQTTLTKFTPTEAAVLAKCFASYADGGGIDGELEMASFQRLAATHFISAHTKLPLERAKVDVIYDGIDRDESGFVAFDEFLRGLSPLLKGTTEEQLRFAFDAFDPNQSGTIDADELMLLMGSGMLGPGADMAVKQLVAQITADMQVR